MTAFSAPAQSVGRMTSNFLFARIELVIKRKELKIKYPLPKWFYVTIILIVVLVVGSSLYATGWAAYTGKFIECGWKKPVYTYQTLGFFGERGKLVYQLPGEAKYGVANESEISLANGRYYCTEEEAIHNGYIHAVY